MVANVHEGDFGYRDLQGWVNDLHVGTNPFQALTEQSIPSFGNGSEQTWNTFKAEAFTNAFFIANELFRRVREQRFENMPYGLLEKSGAAYGGDLTSFEQLRTLTFTTIQIQAHLFELDIFNKKISPDLIASDRRLKALLNARPVIDPEQRPPRSSVEYVAGALNLAINDISTILENFPRIVRDHDVKKFYSTSDLVSFARAPKARGIIHQIATSHDLDRALSAGCNRDEQIRDHMGIGRQNAYGIRVLLQISNGLDTALQHEREKLPYFPERKGICPAMAEINGSRPIDELWDWMASNAGYIWEHNDLTSKVS